MACLTVFGPGSTFGKTTPVLMRFRPQSKGSQNQLLIERGLCPPPKKRKKQEQPDFPK